MERLFLFVYQYRAFFTFLALELSCAWLIVTNNQYQGAKFFNSSNGIVATMNNFSQGVRDYFQLREVNQMLAEENAALKQKIAQQQQYTAALDTTVAIQDSVLLNQYDFESAKVVNNHVDFVKNYITIDKGADRGLVPGMAVISPLGVVGKVKLVSDHYAVITSLLHIDVMVSARLKRTEHLGTIQWNGLDPDIIQFKYIPRHVKPAVGDSVVTTGYAIFPDGIMIGTVAEVNLRDEALFYDLEVKLSQDFRKLSFVTIVKNSLKHEQDSLEQAVINIEK
ncbi:MAG TPA: rod shape-determining protein MreC [Chryseolinea sp.]|nr:rod shape-determining protein MreC [Chryseolinea sp.]